MGLRTTLFGPAWQHRDPATRAEAVARLQDPALLAELAKIATSDSSAEVRRAALQRVTNPTVLQQCRQHDEAATNRQLATERLVQSLCQLSSETAVKDAQNVITELLDTPELPAALLESIARGAHQSALRRQALQRIQRAGFLGDRVLQESDPELRQMALQQIQQPSTLERIAGQLRKTNKKLYREAQQKLASLQPGKPGTGLDQEQALRLCQQLEQLTKGSQQSQAGSLQAQLEQIDRAWQQLSGLDDSIRQRFSNTRAILQQALAGPRSIPTEAPVESEPSPPGADNTADNDTQPEPALQQLAVALDEMLRSKPKPATIENWRESWRSAWRKLASPSVADQRLQDSLRNRLLEHEQNQQQNREARTAREKALQDRVEAVAEAAEAGQLASVTTKLQALRDELPGRPPARLAARLRAIDQQLGELRRWQRWSDNEQRLRLIKAVEKALQDELNADALLNLVRDVRTTWEQLEQQEVSHGMRPLPADHSLARQFKGVCGRAMAQARPFLDNRRKVQQERSSLLGELLDNTRRLLEREPGDARELIKHKRILGKSFRELPGLPPKQRKRTAEAIRQLQDQISQRLTDSFQQAEAEKRKLIRLAEQLQHVADQHEAINQAKQLQRQWQSAGPTARKLDQELWQTFRAQLDPLFEGQQQQRAEQQAEREAVHSRHLELCEQLEALASLGDEELSASAGKVDGLQASWPEHEVFDKRLRQRFQAAGEKFHQRLRSWRNGQRDQRQQARADAAELRQQAVLQLLSEEPQALAAEARQALGELVELSTDELRARLQQHAEQAHQLCITAEFLSGLPSPAEDRAARMQYQVERLAQRMSQRAGQQELSAELRELEREWYANQPLPPEHYLPLNKRFQKALRAAQQLSGA